MVSRHSVRQAHLTDNEFKVPFEISRSWSTAISITSNLLSAVDSVELETVEIHPVDVPDLRCQSRLEGDG